jgi:hypothetical protein
MESLLVVRPKIFQDWWVRRDMQHMIETKDAETKRLLVNAGLLLVIAALVVALIIVSGGAAGAAVGALAAEGGRSVA